MKRIMVLLVCMAGLMMTADGLAAPWMGRMMISDGGISGGVSPISYTEPPVWPGGHSANYGTLKYFINEVAHESVSLSVTVEVFYAANTAPSALDVQIYSNLGRRDFAKVGESPNDAGKPNSYYMTYPMTFVKSIWVNGNQHHVYRRDLTVSKCGVYRLTGRFRLKSGGSWIWHNDGRYGNMKQRDCLIVVSPKKAQQLSILEVNPWIVEAAAGNNKAARSTLEDFTNHDTDGFNKFNLDYVKKLGFNTLWLTPIFPITNWRWDNCLNQ